VIFLKIKCSGERILLDDGKLIFEVLKTDKKQKLKQ
jgi:pyruvate kinase